MTHTTSDLRKFDLPRSTCFLSLAILFLFSPFTAGAQSRPIRIPSDDFMGVLGNFPTGAELVVQVRNGNWIRGELIGAVPDALLLKRNRESVEIPRADIEKVWRLGSRKWDSGALAGTILGGISGAAIAANGSCRESNTPRYVCRAAGVTVGGFLGAGIGLGIGTLVGGSLRSKRLLYFAPDQSKTRTPSSPPTGDPLSQPRPAGQWEPPRLPGTRLAFGPKKGFHPARFNSAFHCGEIAAPSFAEEEGIRP